MYESFKLGVQCRTSFHFFAFIGKKKKKLHFYGPENLRCNMLCIYFTTKKSTILLDSLFSDNPYNLNPKQHRQYLALTQITTA